MKQISSFLEEEEDSCTRRPFRLIHALSFVLCTNSDLSHGLQKEKQEYGHDDTPATDGQNTKKLNSDLYLSYASLLLGSGKEVEEAIGVRPLFSKNGDVSKKQDSCQLRKFRHVR